MYTDLQIHIDMRLYNSLTIFKKRHICLHNAFIRIFMTTIRLANFCPECGGDLKFDPNSKNFICKSCGIFAPREKIDELRDKAEKQSINKRRQLHDDYLDWWQASKREKQKQ